MLTNESNEKEAAHEFVAPELNLVHTTIEAVPSTLNAPVQEKNPFRRTVHVDAHALNTSTSTEDQFTRARCVGFCLAADRAIQNGDRHRGL